MKDVPLSANEIKNVLPSDKTFCLVAGSFDLIHVGHLHLFEFAASLEDVLVVAVLSDRYVQGYKDLSRPVILQKHRAVMVASIRFVDYVYIADVSPNSPEILSLLMPHSVVFGEEAGNEERLAKRIERVKANSPRTKIKLLPRYDEEEISTADIIRKIRSG